jgi:tetratricopeptide (TPR) repeat protein
MNLKTYSLLLVLISSVAFAKSNPKQIQDSISIHDQLLKVDEAVRELRRDQLNYQIERDLLKETFSSNYQTVNIVLAIVLGLFSFVGFMGIRDIGSIKKEYLNELDKLNNLRKDFETKITQYETDQTKTKEDYLSILSANDKQNRRIKILELQEKVSSLVQSQNYAKAIEFIAIALEMDPDNISMLINKGISLWRLGDLSNAISSYKRIIEIDPTNIPTIENLSELYLITNRLADFNELYTKNKAAIKSKGDEALCAYFEAMENYLRQNAPGLKQSIVNYLTSLTTDKEKRTPWDFNDALRALKPKPDDPLGAMILLLIEVLRGTIGRDETITKLGQML